MIGVLRNHYFDFEAQKNSFLFVWCGVPMFVWFLQSFDLKAARGLGKVIAASLDSQLLQIPERGVLSLPAAPNHYPFQCFSFFQKIQGGTYSERVPTEGVPIVIGSC